MGAKVFLITIVLFLLVVSAYSTGDTEADSGVREAAFLSLNQYASTAEQDTEVAEQNDVTQPEDIPEDLPRRHRKRILEPVNAYPREQVSGDVLVQQEASADEQNIEEIIKKIYDQKRKLTALFNLFGDEYREQYNEWINEGATSVELEENVNEMIGEDFNNIYSENLILHISVGCSN